MIDVVRTLISQRLKELGLTMAEASKRIGRNETYLHQYMKRGVPVELHEPERLKLAEVLKVEQDRLRGPSTTLPKKPYERNSSSRKSLIENDVPERYASDIASPARMIPGSDLFGARMDFPLFGTAQGGRDGALVMSARAVDWVARPAVLLRVEDGYGLIVTGDSMSPEHKSGSIALVNPHLPPRIGDSCVFQCHSDDGTTHGLIKEFRGETETHWKVRQHTPPRDFQIKKADWQIVHRTVGNYFP